MTTQNIPAAAAALCSSASTGTNLGAETTTFTAGQTLNILQNNGNMILHLHVTTSGTGTVNALASGNNVSLTLTATGDTLLGPFPTAVFGNTFTISLTSAAGSAACYSVPQIGGIALSANGWHNPFETSVTAADA